MREGSNPLDRKNALPVQVPAVCGESPELI